MTAPLEPIAGPYQPPECKVGDRIECKRRGNVTVAGFSASPMGWPYAMSTYGRPSPVLCGDLLRAIRTEATDVVAELFGVNVATVSIWRNQIGVTSPTPGTLARAAAKAAKRPKN